MVVPLSKGGDIEDELVEPAGSGNDINRFFGNVNNLVVVDLGVSSCLPAEDTFTLQRILSGEECAKACQIERIWWATYYPTNKVCYCE